MTPADLRMQTSDALLALYVALRSLQKTILIQAPGCNLRNPISENESLPGRSWGSSIWFPKQKNNFHHLYGWTWRVSFVPGDLKLKMAVRTQLTLRCFTLPSKALLLPHPPGATQEYYYNNFFFLLLSGSSNLNNIYIYYFLKMYLFFIFSVTQSDRGTY